LDGIELVNDELGLAVAFVERGGDDRFAGGTHLLEELCADEA
jgi:hypothetical protein